MNREIKFEYGFKSVNGIVKKIYHLHEIPNIHQICDVWNVLPIIYVRQFTGLLDKNGNEIYEGDNLLDERNHGDYSDDVAEVRFDNGKFCYPNYGTLSDLSDINDYSEIIGNIYDNS